MFYGVPDAKQGDFMKAMSILSDIFPGQVYAADMLISFGRNLSFRLDQKFMAVYSGAATNDVERSLLWRLHTLAWAARNALAVEGDFVECGVFKGFCSEVIFKYLDFQNLARQAYLYDTFSGLPEQTSTEQERATWGHYANYDPEALYTQVRQKFSGYPNVHIVRGIVPDSFEQAVPEKIAFLHIDMNSEKAEIQALEHLFQRVTPGGFVVLDDFGWNVNVKQMAAELGFMNAHGHQVLEIPTGQGVIIKHA